MPERSAKQVAVKLLARREHSASEIRQKLKQRGFAKGEIDAVLEELQLEGWQSDERYAEAYVRGRRLKGYGPIRIGLELKERGVDEAVYSGCLQLSDAHWLDTLRDEYRRKFHGIAIVDFVDKAKRMRYLQYRGFPLDAIHKVMDEK